MEAISLEAIQEPISQINLQQTHHQQTMTNDLLQQDNVQKYKRSLS